MQIYCLTNFEVVFLNVFFQFLNWLMKGCDGSILISSKPGSKMLSEKDAQDNKDLRVEGFQIITKAKALVESKCPGVVSCADILAIAARDFVHLVSVSFLFTSLVLSAYISNAFTIFIFYFSVDIYIVIEITVSLKFFQSLLIFLLCTNHKVVSIICKNKQKNKQKQKVPRRMS